MEREEEREEEEEEREDGEEEEEDWRRDDFLRLERRRRLEVERRVLSRVLLRLDRRRDLARDCDESLPSLSVCPSAPSAAAGPLSAGWLFTLFTLF